MQYLGKGTQLAVEGQLRQDRWEQDEQKRSRVKINARVVQLLGGRDNDAPARQKEEPHDAGFPDDFVDDDIPF